MEYFLYSGNSDVGSPDIRHAIVVLLKNSIKHPSPLCKIYDLHKTIGYAYGKHA